jgi:mannose-6-phosphate isomerase-like protein (cupin superfamily)
MSKPTCSSLTVKNKKCKKYCSENSKYCWIHEKSDVYTVNIEEELKNNDDFRTVMATGNNLQLVIMTLNPEEDIDFEIHKDNDQLIRIESGSGEARIGKKQDNIIKLKKNDIIFIPKNTYHRIINTSKTKKMKISTEYAPAEHPFNRINVTKPLKD